MGSGSSKKKDPKQDTAQKQQNHSDGSNENKTVQNRTSKTVHEQPEAEQTITSVAKESKSANAKNNIKVLEKWQDADLSAIMGGLELKDDPHVWEKYVDALIAKDKPEICPETQVCSLVQKPFNWMTRI